ncbi:Protein disulfide-isomerase A5, partial [Operophtera brumata]
MLRHHKTVEAIKLKAGGTTEAYVYSREDRKYLHAVKSDIAKGVISLQTDARSCVTCDKVLDELEKIDDDTDTFGVDFVKINDKRLAKQYGITKFPALTYFREKEPIIYDGDLMDEESVLDFLTSLEAMDLPDRIEEVNQKILAKIIEDTDYVAVLFYKPECKKCAKALQELENIDDEADQLGIGFVKIHDEELAEEYSLGGLPRLVYYRHQIPIIYEDDHGDDESMTVLAELEKIDDDCDRHGIQFVKIDDKKAAKSFGIDDVPSIVYFEKQIPNVYDGDLENEEEILEWLVGQLEKDEIEDVTDEMLDKLIKDGKTIAVLFYDNNDRKSQKVLNELENIDDECDQLGIAFVKIDNDEEAKEYGIEKVPTLLYFEKGIPTYYNGNLEEEEKVLAWLRHQSESDEIEDITDEMLDLIIEKMQYVAVLFYDKDQKKSQKVLVELENIDDECDQNDIAFVKIDDDKEAKEYGIETIPTMVFFEKGIPHIYEGDLMKEEDLLGWLLHQKRHSEIPEVTDEMMDKLIDSTPYLAVIFYDKDDKQDIRILNELENIDDELEKEGIVIVRMDNEAEAKEYGIDHLPTLIYFEENIPAIYEGDLMNEDEVLEWLIEQKNSATIEEVTDEILTDLIEEHEYVVVYFSGNCEEGEECDNILDELENIDDELDETGIIFVTTEDILLAKKYGIKTFPTLVFFRNKDPLIYKGDIEDEDEVLSWLTDENTLEIPGKIEEVNSKMLEKILEENDHVVVFFYKEGDKKSQKILSELENIDDECEEKDIDFVKTSDEGIDKEYDLSDLPALAFYRHKFRTIYEGDLMHEEAILKWVLELHDTQPDVIESVDRKTLKDLINNVEHLAVFFYSEDCDTCDDILEELETIDDDTDKHGIQFVKSKDSKLASDIGIFSFPALVYYETGVPIMYDGDLKNENKVLQWLVDQKSEDSQRKNKANIKSKANADRDKKASGFATTTANTGNAKSSDRCFYIGLGAKPAVPKMTYEPYQCCPTKVQSLTKVAKATPTKMPSKNIEKDKSKNSEKLAKGKNKALAKPDKPSKGKKAWFISRIRACLIGFKLVSFQINYTDVVSLKLLYRLVNCQNILGNLLDESEVLDWMVKQKNDESIEEIDRDELFTYIETKEFLAVIFYKDDDPDSPKILRHVELIDDEAAEYGIKIVKCSDRLMAKKYGFRNPPGITYFRKTKYINYDGDIDDEEEILDWLTNPENMELTDHIEKVNRKMFQKIRQTSDYVAVNDCKQCPRVLAEIEHIDDDADGAGINFVKIDDRQMAKEHGVFALPAVLFFKLGSKDPVIYAGDLYDEQQLLSWLLTQKNPAGDVIEALEGQELLDLIEESSSLAVYFWNKTLCDYCDSKAARKSSKKKEKPTEDEEVEQEDGTECEQCVGILEELENIDDDCDRHGIKFVKTQDFAIAESYGVTDFPVLVYFETNVPNVYEGSLAEEEEVLQWLITQKTEDRIELITRVMLERMVEETQYLAVYFCKNGNPLLFEGDLQNEESILEWLIDDDNRELADEIESVNDRMLERLLQESPLLVVFFYDDDDCSECEEILEALEEIDGEVDQYGIDFVKIASAEAATTYNIVNIPSLVYFRKQSPMLYDGDLHQVDRVLQWLTSQDVFEIKNEIEEVNRKMLDKLLEENEFLAVYFYEKSIESREVLEKLENIDSETDNMDITFVKMQDPRYARKWGVTKLPAIVYFRKRFPSIYRGELMSEDEVLEWLRKNRFRQPELNIFMYALIALSIAFVMYTAFLLQCFKPAPPAPAPHPKQA